MKLINLNFCLLIILAVLNFSCSTHNFERIPAQTAETMFDQVFTFSGGEQKALSGENLKTFSEEQLAMHINDANPGRRYEMLVSKSLSVEKPFRVELDVDLVEGKYITRILYHPKAFEDKSATYSMLNLSKSMLEGLNYSSAEAYYELYFNARAGDPIALKTFLGMKDLSLEYLSDDSMTVMSTPEFEQRRTRNAVLLKQLDKEITELKTWQKKEQAKRKAPLAALDKAAEDKQFRTLVAKNDRKGAAKLLRTYLPWEMMAPFEKQFWETHLEVMVNPVPLEERVYIFRGLNEDFIHSGFSKGLALSQKQAIVKNNAFVMSSVMVKNQGSWNRRLRSLEAMNSKTIATIGGDEKYAQSARISTMFLNHGRNPMGSPFLSLSPSLAVASNFGEKRVSSYLIDPRLLHYNYASPLKGEIEYLISLTTFPEDLVGIADQELHGFPSYDVEARQAFLEQKLINKINSVYGESKATNVLMKIKKNSYDFFHKKFTGMASVEGTSPGPSNIKFYKNLGADVFKPDLGPKGELNCRDIIQLFWVKN